MGSDDLKREIRKLTKAQRAVLDQVYCGSDAGINNKVADRLVAKGMLRKGQQTLSGRFPITINRYDIIIPYHIAWCEMMSEGHSCEDCKDEDK